MARITTDVAACLTKLLAQYVDQQLTWLNQGFYLLAVKCE